jgi:putative ABC transport system permease protein
VTALLQDLRFAARVLVRNPMVTIISVLTLGLGIGATAAVFSVVDATMLRPLPFPEPDELCRVYTSKLTTSGSRMTVSLPDFVDWRDRSASFEDMGVFEYGTYNLAAEGHPERVTAVHADAGVLRVLGSPPVVGRAHVAAEDGPGGGGVVMLSHGLWHRRFGGDPAVVDDTVVLDGVAHEIIGVLPPTVQTAVGPFDVWTPLAADPASSERSRRASSVLARLAPGVEPAVAAAEMDAIAARLAEAYPNSNRGYGVRIVSLSEDLLGASSRRVLTMLVASVAFVLLIACVNIANLLLAAATSREREFALRTALGAGTARMVRQILTEAALLASVGGMFGLVTASWGVRILSAGLEATIGSVGDIAVNQRALGFTALVLVATTISFGLPAALRASGTRFSGLIRTGTRSVIGGRGSTMRHDALVVAQVAMALALLISAAVMNRSLLALRAVDPGFDTEGRLVLSVSLPEEQYPSETEQSAFFERALEEVRALPGVRSAAAASTIPLIGNTSNASVTFEDRPDPDPADKIFSGVEIVTPGFLETMGIPLLHGTDLDGVGRGSTPGVIVNQHMVESIWPGESALGKRLKYGPRDSEIPWLEVVGVMGDYLQASLDREVRFETLVSFDLFSSPAMTFVVRTDGDPAAAVGAVQAAVWRIDPGLAIHDVATMAEIRDANTRSRNDLAKMLAAFSLVALVLAVGGLYGVISYTVSRKTHEIGVRMALGAETRTILLSVVRRTAILLAAGVLAGGLLAYLLTLTLRSVLYEVSAVDPVSYLGVAAVMLAVGFAAGLVPATRAARTDPMAALAEE